MVTNAAPPVGGYVFFSWDSEPVTKKAIMGIKQYYAINGSQEVLVFDQERVGKIISIFGDIAKQQGTLQGISEIPHDYYSAAVFTGDGVTLVFSGTLTPKFLVPNTIRFTQYDATGVELAVITDNGVGGLIGTNVNTAASTINYVTGAYTVTFTLAPANGTVFDNTSGIYGAFFTGNISNFFTVCNYQYKAFITNSVDPIVYYNGTSIRYLNTSLQLQLTTSSLGRPSNYNITRCLHVEINRERLLLIYPTVDQIPLVSTIYWSVAGNPLVFTNDESLAAPTSEQIRCISFINTDLVVRFSNSERIFRYTSDAFSPFRFDSTNNMWACDGPYSEINYDSWFSSVGRPAIVGSDAVNVKRVDEIIPDFTDPTRISQQVPMPFINQTSIQQCYGERFDDIKEGWLCYNSEPPDQGAVTASDNILAFNYTDSTYAVYSFPFSCLGFGRIINVPVWGTITTQWRRMSNTWDSYELQSNALLDLAGDQYDRVYQLNSGNTQTVARDPTTTEVPVRLSVITKNFNPFIEDGQLCRLGYVDLFVSAYQTTKLRVQFYVNDQLYVDQNGEPAGYYQENTLTFTPTGPMSPNTDQVKVWKRVYVGSVGKEHTIRFYQNAADFADTDEQPVYIHAMVLYMKPAGMIFQ